MSPPLRLLLVDDSRIFRATLQAALEGFSWVRVVGSVFSGEKALHFVESSPTDLMLLDMEMPGLTSLEILVRLQKANALRSSQPAVGALLLSGQHHSQSPAVREAMAAGAFAFVAKPASPEEASIQAMVENLRPILERFRDRLGRLQITSGRQPPADPATPPRLSRLIPTPTTQMRPALHPGCAIVGIGVSTGGPKALSQLIPDLIREVNVPIVVVQHMPVGFTASLAESLARLAPGWSCAEATDGEELSGKMLRVAPGGRHVEVRRQVGKLVVALTDAPPECGCRPSVNVLFRSLAQALGPRLAVMVLTGMGNDGAAGACEVRRAGGLVLAQDEATSVVWGMPGSVVQMGVVHEVAPLDRLAVTLGDWLRRRASP